MLRYNQFQPKSSVHAFPSTWDGRIIYAKEIHEWNYSKGMKKRKIVWLCSIIQLNKKKSDLKEYKLKFMDE